MASVGADPHTQNAFKLGPVYVALNKDAKTLAVNSSHTLSIRIE